MRRLAALLVAGGLFVATGARADDPGDPFTAANAALARGATRDAIELFEGLADRGVQSADASYDRGLAYVARARSTAAEPGDLGRAAAAFEEALVLRPDDRGAERALDLVRSEIARRRGHEGAEPDAVEEGPTAGAAIVSLLPEETWAILAALGSLVLTLGLVLRGSSRREIRLGSGVATALGLLAVIAFSVPAAAARQARHHVSLAVVVAPEARWLDERGVPVQNGAPAVPEGARVDVLGAEGPTAEVRWGRLSGRLAKSALRVVRFAEDAP